MSNEELPLGIFLLAGLQALQALGVLFVGALWLLVPILGLFISIPYGIVGLFGLFIAFGLFTLQEYAWFWAMILNIIGVVLFVLGENLIGIILSVVIVLYLNSGDIRQRFQ
ncbi:hypothetical protein EU527_11010 [Candidatus Thorarchaeota archaeon]|nr:MAG: hypothetical protein EU527_11010 [Candidatus Thorarchaeota archaeon]